MLLRATELDLMRAILFAAVLALSALSAAALAGSLPPYPAGSNGCSAGISAYWRNVLHKPPPYEHCCNDHDIAYRLGGTWNARRAADAALLSCVARSDGFGAAAMWLGVRAFGTSFFIFDWRLIAADHAAQQQNRRAGSE